LYICWVRVRPARHELEVYQMDEQENLGQIARDASQGGFDAVVAAGGLRQPR
jgi:diacylglycerol kinase family enzyme